MILSKPPAYVGRLCLSQFLADATLAALRAGSPGAIAACHALSAAKTLTKESGVTWDREVPQ